MCVIKTAITALAVDQLFFLPPHQPNSWTQLKAALLQAFSAGAENGIVSGGMGGGGRWGVMVGAACVYCLFAATHTKTDEAQQLALMRVG